MPTRRILFLCSTSPRGPAFGGQLRAAQVADTLAKLGEVRVVVVASDADDSGTAPASRDGLIFERAVRLQSTPRRTLWERLRLAFDPSYLNLHGCVASPADRRRVRELAAESDLVWLWNSRTPNVLGQWAFDRAHLDIDDLPSKHSLEASRHAGRFGHRLRARLEASLLARRERRYRERFATLSVCSRADADYLGGGDGIHVIPNGFPRPSAEPTRGPIRNPPRLGFLGLYDYRPNRQGVEWFLKEAWPSVQAAAPGTVLRLIGKGTDGPHGPTGPGLEPLGWVRDPAAEIATWSAMIIPIWMGAGTRVKLADAFSRKCPVVATPLGAYGYEVADRRHLRLAATGPTFAQACVDLLRDPAEAAALADRAYEDYLARWTWDAIAPRIVAAVEDCLRRSGTSFIVSPQPTHSR